MKDPGGYAPQTESEEKQGVTNVVAEPEKVAAVSEVQDTKEVDEGRFKGKSREKRGPKPKPLSERKMLRTTPIVRKEASYSKRKKQEVIMWMLHTRVDRRGEMVPPSTTDAENHFQIPRSTIAGWKKAM